MIPFPSGRGLLHVGAPAAQVNGCPAISPDIVTEYPCGSDAVRFRDEFPIHHPFCPLLEQLIFAVIVGGLSGFGSSIGSHTTLHEKQHPWHPLPSWSLPAELQETNLSQQLDHPEHGFLSLSVHVVVQFCPAAFAVTTYSFFPRQFQFGPKLENW
jgi:hypothetical protein